MIKSKPRKVIAGLDSRLFFLTLVTISFVLIGIATSTYAWFDIGATSRADLSIALSSIGFDLQIGFKQEDDEIIFKDEISKDDLYLAKNTYGLDKPLEDVTGARKDEWLTEDFDYETGIPKLYQLKNLGAATLGYIQFELYFQSSQNSLLFLSSTSSLLPNKEANSKIAKELSKSGYFEEEVTGSDLDNAIKAIRYSFLSKESETKSGSLLGGYTLVDPIKNQDKTVYGGILDTDLDGYYDTDPVSQKEIVYGKYVGEPIYEVNPLEEEKALNGRHTGFNASHRKGCYLFDKETSLANGLSFEEEKAYSLENVSLKETDGQYREERMHSLAYLPGNTPVRVFFTLYIEGWDLDTTNYISSAVFDLNLNFTALDAANYVA